ncbi:hypothetical protein RRG08_036720 [Elysia crispata]|uniref:Uncharacterized protein n=1 Tax=Elysia crispata TaxID=231223 RepID=A0AAE1CM85_9GAST|nr:hypothetical protein RRG08_036720 [Elysia crispata]
MRPLASDLKSTVSSENRELDPLARDRLAQSLMGSFFYWCHFRFIFCVKSDIFSGAVGQAFNTFLSVHQTALSEGAGLV